MQKDNHPRSCQDTKAQEEEDEEEMKNKIFKAPKIKRKIKKIKIKQSNKKPIKTNNVFH